MNELPYTIEDLIDACNKKAIIWKRHAVQRIKQRGISQNEVIECIYSGEIIETYITDKPFASCLVLGATAKNRLLHVVCSMDDDLLYVITVYEPTHMKWENDLKTRKRVL